MCVQNHNSADTQNEFIIATSLVSVVHYLYTLHRLIIGVNVRNDDHVHKIEFMLKLT